MDEAMLCAPRQAPALSMFLGISQGADAACGHSERWA